MGLAVIINLKKYLYFRVGARRASPLRSIGCQTIYTIDLDLL